VIVAVALGWSAAGYAAQICYDLTHYPAVSGLESAERGLRALVVPSGPRAALGAPIRVESFEWNGEAWRRGEPQVCADGHRCFDEPSCAEAIPPIALSREDFRRARPDLAPDWDDIHIEQGVGPCVREGDVVWFGIAFYQGEGTGGVGGIGRYDTTTQQLEVRRLPELADASVNRLALFGGELFLGTTHAYECVGDPPAAGVLRHDWRRNETRGVPVCGFVASDMLVQGEELWIATDLGVTRVRERLGAPAYERFAGETYVPERGELEMRRVECGALYARLLDSLPTEIDPLTGNVHWQLFETLATRRVQSLYDYVRGRTRPVPEPAEPTGTTP
jgi:hypothetical protein